MKKKKERKLTISERLSKKITSKKVLKPSQLIIEMKESEPVQEVSRFFKRELEETKKSLFFQ